MAQAARERAAESLSRSPAVAVLKKVRHNKLSEVSAMLTEEPLLVAVTNNEGETPLHIAVDEHNQEIARLLLEKGAEVYAKNIYGVTPLEYAENSGQSEMVELLSGRLK